MGGTNGLGNQLPVDPPGIAPQPRNAISVHGLSQEVAAHGGLVSQNPRVVFQDALIGNGNIAGAGDYSFDAGQVVSLPMDNAPWLVNQQVAVSLRQLIHKYLFAAAKLLGKLKMIEHFSSIDENGISALLQAAPANNLSFVEDTAVREAGDFLSCGCHHAGESADTDALIGGLHDFQHSRQDPGIEFIVAVEEHHVTPARRLGAGVSRGIDAAIDRQTDVPNARIVKPGDDGGRVVGGAIISHHPLQMGVLLTHALPNSGQERGPVVGRRYHADVGHACEASHTWCRGPRNSCIAIAGKGVGTVDARSSRNSRQTTMA